MVTGKTNTVKGGLDDRPLKYVGSDLGRQVGCLG